MVLSLFRLNHVYYSLMSADVEFTFSNWRVGFQNSLSPLLIKIKQDNSTDDYGEYSYCTWTLSFFKKKKKKKKLAQAL